MLGSSFLAAILAESNAPLIVDEAVLPNHLEAGQVLVKVRYSGICGAQINEIDAVKGPDTFLPHLLGHEGLGEVIATGALVNHVQPGDAVVLHWMPGDGFQSDPARYQWRGQALNAGWVTTLSEITVVSSNRCTRINSTVDPHHLPLLGCAATTAVGVISRDAGVGLGESVVVLGAGGVGLLVVEAARASGAYPIIAVDRVTERLTIASSMGAQATFEVMDEGDGLRNAIVDFLGRTPDVVIETSGARSMIELSYRLVSKAGRTVLVGVPRHDEPARIDTLPLHFDTIMTGSKGGQTKPQIDIPRIARLAEVGMFRLDALPLTVLPLSDVNVGIDMVRAGAPGRVVIDMEQ